MDVLRRQLLVGMGEMGLAVASESIAAHEADWQKRLALPNEEPLEPDMPIIDAHHHLWWVSDEVVTLEDAITDDAARKSTQAAIGKSLGPVTRFKQRYLLEEYLNDIRRGKHNVVASVFMEAGSMYRAQGPAYMRSVGEVEFASGAAAMAASHRFGKVEACAGIVGCLPRSRDPREVKEVLQAYIRAGNGRLKGVRTHLFEDGAPSYLGRSRDILAALYEFELSLDIGAIEPNLPQVVEIAQAFPGMKIILDHVGLPIGIGAYKGKRDERYSHWLRSIRTLSECPNVVIKLGGLGMPIADLPSYYPLHARSSEQIAAEWKPYIEPCIESFGADRSIFESNFPADALTCSYSVLWNSFKRFASGASGDEKRDLFYGTAYRTYNLSLEGT